ncbi:MAG: BA14K family protein [Proteobacteria bacterium]|nr:BA14K family protein [Pseudomonadota bacterium]
MNARDDVSGFFVFGCGQSGGFVTRSMKSLRPQWGRANGRDAGARRVTPPLPLTLVNAACGARPTIERYEAPETSHKESSAMATTLFARSTAALGLATLLAVTAAPATAAPVLSSTSVRKTTATSNVVDVRYRGRGAGVAAGIATGLIIGGIIASQPRYYGYYYGGPPPQFYGPQVFYPPGYYGPMVTPGYGRGDWLSYCFSRYRSFDPVSGTYMGYDGRRHLCR